MLKTGAVYNAKMSYLGKWKNILSLYKLDSENIKNSRMKDFGETE